MSLNALLVGESILGLAAALFGILAARAYRGGTLSSAITWIVVGQVTMSIGHMVMAFDMIYMTDTFVDLLGAPLGSFVFRVVVLFSLFSSILGFFKLWSSTRPK